MKKFNNGYEFVKDDDGEFYMCFEDFCKYYGSLGICHFYMKYYYMTKKVSALKSKGDNEDIQGMTYGEI